MMEPLAPFENSQSNTNLSRSILLAILDRNDNWQSDGLKVSFILHLISNEFFFVIEYRLDQKPIIFKHNVFQLI